MPVVSIPRPIFQDNDRTPTPADGHFVLGQSPRLDRIMETILRPIPRKVCLVNPERLNRFRSAMVSPVTPSIQAAVEQPSKPHILRHPPVPLPGPDGEVDGLAPPECKLAPSSKRPKKRRRLSEREEQEIIEAYAVSIVTCDRVIAPSLKRTREH